MLLFAVRSDTRCLCDSLTKGHSFEVILDPKAFHSICNSLGVRRLNLPVIMTGHRPTCWKCGESGQHFSFCTKKAPESQAPINQNPPLAASVNSASAVMDCQNPRSERLNPRLGLPHSPHSHKRLCPLFVKLLTRKWLFFGMVRRKRQTAGHLSPEAPRTKSTDRTTNFKTDVPASKTTTAFYYNYKRNTTLDTKKRRR